MDILFLIVSFLSSIVGAICGIGGGVVIKPVLDMLQMGNAATINFLSGCTVLSMSLYSVGKSLRADSGMVSGVQAVSLGIITVGTLLYTIYKNRIPTLRMTQKTVCVGIGLLLGIMSSFLGIGGGPINLVVLGYFFSMDTKTAAANSLYIILFSQAASLLATLVTASVPEFRIPALILMVAGGIGGGIVGRGFNKKMDNGAVDKLFIGLMAVIITICVYNAVRAFI